MAKVLVVDDNRDMCRIISDVLRSEEGHEVTSAHDGASALKRLKREAQDVMILDYKLPEVSGLTVLENVRKVQPLVCIIMISAYGEPSVKARAKELGAYDFLDKPFNIEKLARIVERALKERTNYLRKEVCHGSGKSNRFIQYSGSCRPYPG